MKFPQVNVQEKFSNPACDRHSLMSMQFALGSVERLQMSKMKTYYQGVEVCFSFLLVIIIVTPRRLRTDNCSSSVSEPTCPVKWTVIYHIWRDQNNINDRWSASVSHLRMSSCALAGITWFSYLIWIICCEAVIALFGSELHHKSKDQERREREDRIWRKEVGTKRQLQGPLWRCGVP